MKILHVGDLHRRGRWLDWVASHAVDYSLLVVAGDLQDAFGETGMHQQARELSAWLRSLPVDTIVCSGNHDTLVKDPRISRDVYAEAGWLRMLKGHGNIRAVDGDSVTIEGHRVVVNGWLKTPLSQPMDILVSHAPFAGCACAGGAEGQDNGDQDLWSAIEDAPPRLLLSAHIHQPNRVWCRWPVIDPTTLVLVPGFDDLAKEPQHWSIDTVACCACHIFESVSDLSEITVSFGGMNQRVVLCHYAMRVWPHSHHGAWHLYGHSHGTLPDDPKALSIDVGVDCWEYAPVSVMQIAAKMKRKAWKPVDHHGRKKEEE